MSSYDFEGCWKYISGNYDADLLDTKEHFMGQLKLMMETTYDMGYDTGKKDGESNAFATNSNYCEFCANHCKDDTLYERSSYDGGVGFDYIRDIKFCPICGKELQDN